MKLYPLVTQARLDWDAGHSHYICDCLTKQLDDLGETDFTYPPLRPLLDYIAESIKHQFSVAEFLFGRPMFKLNPEQLDRVQEFREDLWKRLFDLAAELDAS
jgi:hypothetical protein